MHIQKKNLNTEKLKALFADHCEAIIIQTNLNSFVDTLVIQIQTNGLDLDCGVKITALVDIEDCHPVAVLIPSHHFHSLIILEEIIQHELQTLNKRTVQFAHNYLLNKNQLNLFKNA